MLHFIHRNNAMVTIRGIAVLARMKYLERYASPEQHRAVLDQLPPEFRDELENGVDVKKMYRFDHFVALKRAIDQHLGKGDLQLIVDQGRFAAVDLMPGFAKIFRKFLSARNLIQKSIQVWNRLYSSGRMEIETGEPGTYLHCLRLTLRDFGEPTLELGLMMLGVVRGALQMGGAREYLVTRIDPPAAPGAELEIMIQWSL